MRLALGGDAYSYRTVLDAITPHLRNSVRRLLARAGKGTAIVENIVQEVLLSATDHMFRGLDGWLVRIFGKSIVACLTAISLLALLPLAVSLYAFPVGAPTSPAFIGGLADLASYGVTIIADGVFCTENSPVFVTSLGAVLRRSLLHW